MLTRRRFVGTLSASLLAAPLVGEAQATRKMYRVGYLASASAATEKLAIDVFREELQRQGWAEGVNLVVIYRFAEGDARRLVTFAEELIGASLDVLVTRATPSLRESERAASPTAVP
jgi:putative ABC transport system substrate-binding protein